MSKKGQPRVVTRTIKALKAAAAALTDLAERYSDAFAPEFLNELAAFTAWLNKFTDTLAATDFTKAEKNRGRK